MQSCATKPIGPTERRNVGMGSKNQVLTAEWEDGIPPDLIISFQLKPLPEITEEIDFVSCPPAPATSADTRTCAKSKGESSTIRDHQMITTMTLCKKKEKHPHSLANFFQYGRRELLQGFESLLNPYWKKFARELDSIDNRRRRRRNNERS